MDILVVLRIIFGGSSNVELLAILLIAFVFIFIVIYTESVRNLLSIAGVLVVVFSFLFAAVIVRFFSLFVQDKLRNLVVSKIEQKIDTHNPKWSQDKNQYMEFLDKDDGEDIYRSRVLGILNNGEYSEQSVKEDIERIIKDFNYEIIQYITDIISSAKRMRANNPNVLYLNLEDYAFLCSLNICNKYIFDFNTAKQEKSDSFLIVILPMFRQVLEEYK